MCKGVHRCAWGRFSKIRGECMHYTQCSRVAYPCPLEPSCMTTHGEHMAAQVVSKNGSGDGGVRSHQVPSKVQGGAGNACEGRHGGCMEGVWHIQLDPRGTHCTRCGRDGSPYPIGNARRAHQWGSRDGGVRSYQVPSKTQGTHVREDMGGAWGCI